MNEERPFLAAIQAEPDNRSAKLVYADWLEERDDPRGELIRVEEELRAVPIYSDRYWELKPRRNQLHSSAKPSWYKRMGYLTDNYQPVFRDVPDGWKERWRLIREFTERWYRLPMSDVGGPIAESPISDQERQRGTWGWGPHKIPESDAIEQQLLDSFPPSLREWFAFTRHLSQQRSFKRCLSGRTTIVQMFDSEILIADLDEDYLVCVVRKEQMQQHDPAVEWVCTDSNEFFLVRIQPGAKIIWRLAVPHVTTFACQYIVQTIKSFPKSPGGFWTPVTDTTRLIQQLTDFFPVHSKFDQIHIFERHDMIALLDSSPFCCWGGNEPYLQVELFKPISLEEIPGFLTKQISPTNRSFCYGIFHPLN